MMLYFFQDWPVRLGVRTPGFHPGSTGSNPVRATTKRSAHVLRFFIICHSTSTYYTPLPQTGYTAAKHKTCTSGCAATMLAWNLAPRQASRGLCSGVPQKTAVAMHTNWKLSSKISAGKERCGSCSTMMMAYQMKLPGK